MDSRANNSRRSSIIKYLLQRHDYITRMLRGRIWIELVFIGLCLIFLKSSLSNTSAHAAEISKDKKQVQDLDNLQSHIQDELIAKKPTKVPEINIFDKSELARLKSAIGKTVFENDGIPSSLWKVKEQIQFSQKIHPEISIIRKEISSSELPNIFFDVTHDENEPIRKLRDIKLTQKLNTFTFGAEYRYVGNDLQDLDRYKKMLGEKGKIDNDQEKIDVWGAKKIGPVGFKAFFSRSWDNVESDPEKYQMLESTGGAEIDFKAPYVPIWFNFSYSKSMSESTIEPKGSKTKGQNGDSISGSLYYYMGNAFDITLSSNYFPSQDRIRSNRKTETFWHEISANIRPTWYITITPTISYGEYRYLWYGERTENPSASLSVSLSKLFKTVDIYFWESYSRMRGTDGYQDDMMFNTALGISWKAKYFTSLPKMKFSIDLDHYSYIDKIYSESSSNDMGTSFSVKFPF